MLQHELHRIKLDCISFSFLFLFSSSSYFSLNILQNFPFTTNFDKSQTQSISFEMLILFAFNSIYYIFCIFKGKLVWFLAKSLICIYGKCPEVNVTRRTTQQLSDIRCEWHLWFWAASWIFDFRLSKTWLKHIEYSNTNQTE